MDQEIAVLNEPIITQSNIKTDDAEPLIKINEVPQHGNITQLSSSEPIVSVADHSNQSYTIGKAIFKGIMKLISKKSSEWTSDVLKIESKELNQKHLSQSIIKVRQLPFINRLVFLFNDDFNCETTNFLI